MPALAYARGAYERSDLPELEVVNQYAEVVPAEVDGRQGFDIVLIGRPGLARHSEVGTGPIRGLFSQPGALGGDLFAVSGSALYRAGSSLGAIGGSGLVQMAATPGDLLVANGIGLSVYDGTALTAINFPDGAGVAGVAYLAGYSLAIRTGTRRIYFTLDPLEWDGLDYFAAEQDTAPVLGIAILREQLWVFTERTVEVFLPSGDPDAPFQRLEGQFYDRGCLTGDSIAKMDNTLFWVGEDRKVYRADQTPLKVSNDGIDERLARSLPGDIRAWPYPWGGHVFYTMRTAEGTFAYDAATREWHEAESLGRNTWRAHVGIEWRGNVLAGDDETGTIWRLNDEQLSDDGIAISRRVTAVVGNAPQFLDNIHVSAATGQAPTYGAAPVLERRISRDRGATWSSWAPRSLGDRGQRRARAVWLRNGLADEHSVIEFRVTDSTPWRFSSVRYNDPLAGLATVRASNVIRTAPVPMPRYNPALDFSDARNSAYVALLFEDF